MKKSLSSFLSVILALSMLLGTLTIGVYAETTGGVFTTNSNTSYKYIEDDFESWSNDDWSASTTVYREDQNEQGYRFYRRRNDLTGANGFASSLGRGAPLSVVSESGNKYLELKDVASDGYIYSRYMFYTNASALGESEKLYFSVDLKTSDKFYDKKLGITKHHNMGGSDLYKFITFTKDGSIVLFNNDDASCTYSMGEWYHFDIVYDNSDGTTTCRISSDGSSVITESLETNIGARFSGDCDDIAFLIDHSLATNPSEDDSTKATDLYNSSLCVDNLKAIIYSDSEVLAEKPSITSVGSDGNKVSYDTTELTFTLDDEIPGLEAEHIILFNGSDKEYAAESITVSDNGSEYVVKAVLKNPLEPWESYRLELDKNCFGGLKYEADANGSIKFIENIGATFTVNPAPFSLKTPEFNISGDTVSVETVLVNNTSDAKDAAFILVHKDDNGEIISIDTEEYTDLITDEAGQTISLSADNFTSGSAKLFVIKGWENPTLLFDTYRAINYDGSDYAADLPVATSDAEVGEINLDAFNHTTKKITVKLNSGSEENGVIYVYKRGSELKDSLIYADFITTSADGSLEKEIQLPLDIDSSTNEYTVSFYTESSVLSADFAIYDASHAHGGNISQLVADTTGRNYNDYISELTGIWTNNYIEVESSEADSTAFNLVYNRADKSMRFVITPGDKDGTKGIHTVSFKLYGEKAKQDGTIDFETDYIVVNRRDGHTDSDFNLTGLKAQNWYDIKFVFDLESNPKTATISVTDLTDGTVAYTDTVSSDVTSDEFTGVFTNMWMYVTYAAGSTEAMLIKDFCVLADYGEEKPAIRYIGENKDGIVQYGQNEITFKISKDNGITADDVYVTDTKGAVIKAESIEKHTDMGEVVVKAKMEKSFASWSDYLLNVEAIGYENYREEVSGSFVKLKPATLAFKTLNAPVDMQEPEFTSGATPIELSTYIANTSGERVDVNVVLSVIGSDGTSYVPVIGSYSVPNGTTGTNMPVNMNADISKGDTARVFVVKDLINPVPLFNKYWTVNYDGTIPADVPAVEANKENPETISLETFDFGTSFDYKNKKLAFSLNTGKGRVVDGALFIFPVVGDTIGTTPVYADYVTTASNGTLLKEIKLPSAISDNDGSYALCFYSNELPAPIKAEFKVYKPYNTANAVGYKEQYIYSAAKESKTAAGLKQVILGTDSSENVVNTQWDIFSEDANLTDYKLLRNKDVIFNAMIQKVSSLNSYDELIALFENTAKQQLLSENSPSSSPSMDNTSFGGSSVAMKDTPTESKPVVSAQGAELTDIKGHWAEEFVTKLYKRGIMKGYPDGSFGGNNSITRAELAKTLVEAFSLNTSNDKVFADVNDTDWFAPYVSGAAKAGIITGVGNNSFAPNNYVTRQDATLMLYRAMSLEYKLPEGFTFFTDDSDISDYSYDAIRCLGELGIVKGDEKTRFNPVNEITRAEVATIICRALDYMEAHQ